VAEDSYVTSATKPAKKTARKPAAVKKATPVKKATAVKKVAPVKKATAVKKAAAVKKAVVRVKKATVIAAPEPAPVKKARAPRPLVAKVLAGRNVVLPFRERLEEAMHRELKHEGPVCHVCRMNCSRLAALASAPRLVAV
jgi:hypothetical protein